MHWWHQIVKYYTVIGERFNVNPTLFVGIHVIATPLFAVTVAWIVYNKKANKPILLPSLVAALVFNAANIYLIIFGSNIPWWVYTIVGGLAVISGYITFKKIRTKLGRLK